MILVVYLLVLVDRCIGCSFPKKLYFICLATSLFFVRLSCFQSPDSSNDPVDLDCVILGQILNRYLVDVCFRIPRFFTSAGASKNKDQLILEFDVYGIGGQVTLLNILSNYGRHQWGCHL